MIFREMKVYLCEVCFRIKVWCVFSGLPVLGKIRVATLLALIISPVHNSYSASFAKVHFHPLSISLRNHFESTSIPLRFHFGQPSNSLRYHIDPCNFITVSFRCNFSLSSISLRFYIDFISFSLRSHIWFASVSLWSHIGFSFSLRPRIDLTSVPHRFHRDFTSVFLRIDFGATSISLRSPFDSTSGAGRLTQDFRNKSGNCETVLQRIMIGSCWKLPDILLEICANIRLHDLQREIFEFVSLSLKRHLLIFVLHVEPASLNNKIIKGNQAAQKLKSYSSIGSPGDLPGDRWIEFSSTCGK